jgi:predicted esterase
MEMSTYDFDKKHSFVNSALSVIWSQGLLLPIFDYSKFQAESVMVSFKNCVESVKDLTLSATHGTILIGSSWGGAVALWLIAHELFSGNILVFAPALKTVLIKSGYNNQQINEIYDKIRSNSIDKGHKILVAHGVLDIVVPLKDSIELCNAVGAELITVPLGDHNINGYLIAENNLEGLVARLAEPS